MGTRGRVPCHTQDETVRTISTLQDHQLPCQETKGDSLSKGAFEPCCPQMSRESEAEQETYY